jgi:hypothetical protein
MKRLLWVMIVGMLVSLTSLGISQARECVYLYGEGNRHFYYEPSLVEYAGGFVNLLLYEGPCSNPADVLDVWIDCTNRTFSMESILRDYWVEGKPIGEGSALDTLRVKYCK